MLTVQLALEAGDSLHLEKQALIDEEGLSLAVSVPDSSEENVKAGIFELLVTERVLHLNQEELYFVELGNRGPYSPQNELEALYHLHQLLTDSPIPTANQPTKPQVLQTSASPLFSELSTPNATTIEREFADSPSQTASSTPRTTQTSPINPEVKKVNTAVEIREAARAEVERRLIAYGARKGAAEVGDLCTAPAERDLMTWAKQNSVVSRLSPAAFPSTGRGAMAAVDVGVGEPILEVPERLIISGITAMASDMANTFSRIPDLDEDTAALLWSMRERHVADSHWAPFFRSLPAAFSTGLSFGPRAVRELEGTPAYEGLLAAQHHLRSQYAALFPALSDAHPETFPAPSFTWPDFLWAAELWYSYGIKVQFSDGRIRTALVPLVSLLNHATHPHVTHFSRVNPLTRKLCLPTARPCCAGQQCFLSYGPLQPSDLLTFYGFTVDDNPYDAVQMDLELPDDELSAAKQVLLSAWGLGLSHFLRGEKVPSRLHEALRVLLMDEDDLRDFQGDPRQSKVSDANEAAVIETLLSTVDGLLAAAEESQSQAGIDTTNMTGGAEGTMASGMDRTEGTRADGMSGTEESRANGLGRTEEKVKRAEVTKAERMDEANEVGRTDRGTRADGMDRSGGMETSNRTGEIGDRDARGATPCNITSARNERETTEKARMGKKNEAQPTDDSTLEGDRDRRTVKVAKRYREQHIASLVQIRRMLSRMAAENGFQLLEA